MDGEYDPGVMAGNAAARNDDKLNKFIGRYAHEMRDLLRRVELLEQEIAELHRQK